MNFKGTTNIPREQVKGHHRGVRRQLERLHLDRPDHLPRDRHPRRARPHALHRGRADGERPLRPRGLRVGADGDHLGTGGRRERSRSAARDGGDCGGVQGAPVRPPDDRVAGRPATDDARRPATATTAATTSRTTPRWSSSATWTRTTSCGAWSARFGGIPPGAVLRARHGAPSRPQAGERRVTVEREGTAAYLKARVPCAGRVRRGFRAAARAGRGADGAKGINLWSSFRTRAAAAQRAAVPGAGRGPAGLVGRRRAAADRPTRSSTRSR